MRPSGDPVLRSIVLVGVLVVPWLLLGPFASASSWVLQTATDVLTVVIAARLFRLTGTPRPARRFWAAAGLAMALSSTGDLYQTVLVLGGRPGDLISPVQTGLVVTGMVVVVITMLLHPLGGTGRQRLRMWLDATTVLIAVAAYLWYFLLAGQLSDGHATADRLAAAATATSMMLVSFGLVKLIFSPTAPFSRSAGIVGALGIAVTAVGAPVASLLVGHSNPRVMLVAQLLPCLLVPMSLRMQEVQTRRLGGPREATERRGFSKFPYVAVAATQILLVAGLAAHGPDLRIWGVAAGVVFSTSSVLVRQVAAFHDNERLLIEIRDQKEWFSALVQHASDLTVVTSGDGTVGYASPAAERVLGAPLTGEQLNVRVHPDDLPALRALANRLAAAPGTGADAEIRLRHPDGAYRWLHIIGTDLRGNDSIGGIVWNGRDITEARRLRDELRHQATHDALTGLPNRALLQERAQQAAPDSRLGVLLIDLDGFKQVNDAYGHHAGDQVLIVVARRITALLGASGTVARLGGDEFAVLLPGADPVAAGVLAQVISAAVAEPIALDGRIAPEGPIAPDWRIAPDRPIAPDGHTTVVSVGASVGVACGNPTDADRMLRDADAEMYRNKQSRKAAA